MRTDLLLSTMPMRRQERWGSHNTVLYNLGVGIGLLASQRSTLLPYVLEEKVHSFPTMATVMGRDMSLWEQPDLGFDFSQIVHGEEILEVMAPVPPDGEISITEWVDDISDRGAGKPATASTVREIRSSQDNQLFARCRSILVIRGAGGFGGPKPPPADIIAIPDRIPDGSLSALISIDQALLYRLSGDRNLLHVEPDHAAAAGFPKPILMGLCSFGIAVRMLSLEAGLFEPDRLAGMRTRFTGAVFPGDMLQVDYWHESRSEIRFRAYAQGRPAPLLDGGQIKLR
ncbi:MaoC/PaaZ C-terminal domain-containing protein [Sphingobium sp. WCS2017Hpa-17]|uniref:MaoC/PaaZ C-terminal domain-containing protein n=1 Tax=Sphingobium sp. WCS2017Hpa-17 TaxID=3073638 RepID=UPI00288C4CC3|nr:MaoC/PaaZ C-terminal domain-containing protein [Sphingobium sp. WCS2017Hpa-17]